MKDGTSTSRQGRREFFGFLDSGTAARIQVPKPISTGTMLNTGSYICSFYLGGGDVGRYWSRGERRVDEMR